MNSAIAVWRSQISETTKNLSSIAWTGRQFVIVGSGWSDGLVLTSQENGTWTLVESPDVQGMNSLVWTGDWLVAVGLGAGGGRTMASKDGRNWSFADNIGRQVLTSVIWTGKQIFAGGPDGWLRSSGDGLNWKAIGFVPMNIESLVFTGDLFVVVRDGIQTSRDGKDWTSQRLDGKLICSSLSCVAWNGQKATLHSSTRLIAVGREGLILSSPDGIKWKKRDSGCKNHLMSAVWTGSRFLVIGEGGIILASSDGVSWESQDSPTTETLRAVATGGGRLVAVGDKGMILSSEMDANERAFETLQQTIADNLQRETSENKRRAEKERKRELQAIRAAAGVCIECGEPLSFLQKLTGKKRHNLCKEFSM